MTRVGIAGAGQWGQNLVRVFHELGSLYAIADASPTIQQKMKASYPEALIVSSLADLLRESAVDAVALATPASDHWTHAKMVLDSGKHLFIEKPMTLSSAEAEALVNLAAQKNRTVMVGHLLLYNPAIRILKDLLEKSAIGELYSIHQERCKLGRIRSVEDVLWSFGVHDLAVMQYLIGAHVDKTLVTHQEVIPKATDESVPDDVHLHLKYDNGVQAHLHVSWLWPENHRRLVLVGSRGALLYDEVGHTLQLRRYVVEQELGIQDLGVESIPLPNERPLTVECQHFLNCIETASPPLSDVQQGLQVISILEQATEQWKGRE